MYNIFYPKPKLHGSKGTHCCIMINNFLCFSFYFGKHVFIRTFGFHFSSPILILKQNFLRKPLSSSIKGLKRNTKRKKLKKKKKVFFTLIMIFKIFKNSKVLLRWCLFFDWIEKIKIFGFFYSAKSTLLILINITKMNLLSISLV